LWKALAPIIAAVVVASLPHPEGFPAYAWYYFAIFAAFIFALGYDKTGLGRRISLVLVRKMGRRTLTLGYAVTIAETILAPFTPSNTARSGGTIYPVIRNLPAHYGSRGSRW
jgi:di/tricarboxylate transporter